MAKKENHLHARVVVWPILFKQFAESVGSLFIHPPIILTDFPVKGLPPEINHAILGLQYSMPCITSY